MSKFYRIIIFGNIIITIVVICFLLSKYSYSDKLSNDQIEVFLENHPEVIISSLEKYRNAQLKDRDIKIKDTLSNAKDSIYYDKSNPRIGDPNSKIKIIEFFDYNCGYCHKMAKVKHEIISNNKDVEIIFKEMPIMGEASVIKSKASLAMYNIAPQKHVQFQEQLFSIKENQDKLQTYIDLAIKAGVDGKIFENIMKNDSKLDEQLNNNIKLGMSLGLQGTPAYIIGDEIVPGYINYETFADKIKQQRK